MQNEEYAAAEFRSHEILLPHVVAWIKRIVSRRQSMTGFYMYRRLCTGTWRRSVLTLLVLLVHRSTYVAPTTKGKNNNSSGNPQHPKEQKEQHSGFQRGPPP